MKSMHWAFILLLPWLCGCSLLTKAGGLLEVERESPVIPTKPQPSLVRIELRNELADYVARFVAKEWAGLEEQSKQATIKAAEAVTNDLGSPTSPLVLTETKRVEEVVEKHQKELAIDRKEENQWGKKIINLTQESTKRGWSVSSPALGTWVLFGIGGLGAVLLGVGKKLWAYRKTVLQLVPGIAKFMLVNPTAGEDLGNELSRTMDTSAKKVVKSVKTGAGL